MSTFRYKKLWQDQLNYRMYQQDKLYTKKLQQESMYLESRDYRMLLQEKPKIQLRIACKLD